MVKQFPQIFSNTQHSPGKRSALNLDTYCPISRNFIFPELYIKTHGKPRIFSNQSLLAQFTKTSVSEILETSNIDITLTKQAEYEQLHYRINLKTQASNYVNSNFASF